MRNVLNSLTDIEKKRILEMHYKTSNKKYLMEQGWEGLGKPEDQPYDSIEIDVNGKKMKINRDMCKSSFNFVNTDTQKEFYNKCLEKFTDLSSDKQFFINSYPLCCKYKDISIAPSKGKEWLPFDESKNVGYCFVKSGIKNIENGTEVGVMISNDDTLVFTTTETQNSMSTELVLKFSENNYENMVKSGQLSPLNSKLWELISNNTDYNSQEEKYNNTLLPYFQQVVNNTFPVDSIAKINSQGNGFAVSLKKINSTGELGFDFWYDFTGNAFDEAEYTDNRTKFQKYMDEYGLVTSLGVAVVGAILGIVTGGATWALTLEILLDLGVGIASAVRDFEKGDNVSGFVNLISGGWSGARFFKTFRGIKPSEFNELVLEMQKAGINNSSTPEEIELFLETLAKEKPNLSQVLAKASKFDEFTFNQLSKALEDDITDVVMENVKKAVIDSPDKVFNVSFWKRLWVLDLKRQFGTIGVGLALDFSPLGGILNDRQKQAYKWVLQKLPDNKKIGFDLSMAKDNDVAVEFVDNVVNKDLEKKLSNWDEKKCSQFLLNLHKNIAEKNNKKTEVDPQPVYTYKSKDWLLKNGYVEVSLDEFMNNAKLYKEEDIEITEDGWWIKNYKK